MATKLTHLKHEYSIYNVGYTYNRLHNILLVNLIALFALGFILEVRLSKIYFIHCKAEIYSYHAQPLSMKNEILLFTELYNNI